MCETLGKEAIIAEGGRAVKGDSLRVCLVMEAPNRYTGAIMSSEEMPKAYDPQAVEDGIYAAWEASGFFNPDNLPGDRSTPYTISLPPPNTTGTLHLGHAMYTVQDILIRFERMRGKAALWLPGTDHAAIATNAKVERLLKEEGLTRHNLGREKFVERVNAFIKQSQGTINRQLRKMGFSLDWSREAYTLDEPRNRAVREMFKRMYDAKLIYRGHRVVNWDPNLRTNVSDDELEHVEKQDPFYWFQYGPFVIGTVRPETKFGDKYVVMHPEDGRYKDYQHGDTFECEWINGPITATVIKDEAVDPEFGSGVMTITPWHTAIDFEIAERHGLDKEQVIDFEGNLLPIAGEFAGMPIEEARPKIVEKLQKKGLVVKVEEEYVHNIAINSRAGGIIEPQVREQWFIDVNKPFAFVQSKHHPIEGLKSGQEISLKEVMRHVVTSGQITFVPERFEKIYFSWIDNLRDWNISRQIWFGHQVPVWYKGEDIVVGETPEGDGWEQDPDVLDTWFSSGIWTFSTLGWPDDTADLKRFHPTDVLETGYDIIFFWVARMILMTTFALGEVPFRTVYLHGLVRDEQGRKMSKSLDNIIDPLDVAEKYGTDAVRLALIIGSTPGQDKNLSEQKIEAYRNFGNKLWNIARFVLGVVEVVEVVEGVEARTLADRWILSRLGEVTTSVTKKLETFQLSSAAEELRDFTWGDFADWYLEIAKIEKDKDDILLFALERILVLWHPFIPFVTEEIWKRFSAGSRAGETRSFLMVHDWPESGASPLLFSSEGGSASGGKEGKGVVREQMQHLQDVIVAIRNLRSENNVEARKKVVVTLVSQEAAKMLDEQKALIHGLARVESLTISSEKVKPGNSASTVVGTTEVYLSLEGLVDMDAERDRLVGELEEARTFEAKTKVKLDNKEFISYAPTKIVESIKETYAQTQERIQKLESQLARLA